LSCGILQKRTEPRRTTKPGQFSRAWRETPRRKFFFAAKYRPLFSFRAGAARAKEKHLVAVKIDRDKARRLSPYKARVALGAA
jgi:hypothetical protein